MKPTLRTQIKESQQGVDYVNSLVPKNEIGLNWEIYKRAIKNNKPKDEKRFKNINAFEKFLFAVFAMGVIFYVCLFIYWINH